SNATFESHVKLLATPKKDRTRAGLITLAAATQRGSVSNWKIGQSAKSTGNVLFGTFIMRRGEDLLRGPILDQLAQIHEGGVVAGAAGLLHIVGDDHDRVVGRQFFDQLF